MVRPNCRIVPTIVGMILQLGWNIDGVNMNTADLAVISLKYINVFELNLIYAFSNETYSISMLSKPLKAPGSITDHGLAPISL